MRYITCSAIYDQNPDITVGEMIENYFVPVYASEIGSAQYAITSDGYPCIVLPWADSTINDDYNVVVRFAQKAAVKVSSFSATQSVAMSVGVMDMSTKYTTLGNIPTWCMSTKGSTTRAFPSVNFQHSDSVIDSYKHEDGYDFGIDNVSFEEKVLNLTKNAIVTTMKKVEDDTPVNSLIVVETSSSSTAVINLYYKNNTITHERIEKWPLPMQDLSANMYQLNNGIMYHDHFYVCFPHYHTILKQFAVCNKNSPSVMWSTYAHISGKKFTLKIPAGGGDSGDVYIAIAKIED